MKRLHVATPIWESPAMSDALGRPVLLKMEALQPVGSFKLRGIGHACQAYCGAGAAHLVSSSGGNAGYAVAYAGRRLGVEVTVVVPKTTPEMMRTLIRRQGSRVIEHGDDWDGAHAYASDLAERRRAAYIHPFDDPLVWHGHASLIDEIARSGLKPGVVVVAVGGGGLLCGVLEGLHQAEWGDVPVVAVETEGAASFARSFEVVRVAAIAEIDTVATTLGARTVAVEALAWTKRHQVIPWVVSDRSAVDACLRFADDHRVLVEPACGAALSAAYEKAVALASTDPVLVIVCGGAGVSLDLLYEWDRELDRRTPGSNPARPN